MICDVDDKPCILTYPVRTVAPLLEKQSLADGVVALKDHLCADGAYLVRVKVYCSRRNRRKLPLLEDDILYGVFEPAAFNSVHDNIADTYLARYADFPTRM